MPTKCLPMTHESNFHNLILYVIGQNMQEHCKSIPQHTFVMSWRWYVKQRREHKALKGTHVHPKLPDASFIIYVDKSL